MAAELKQEFTNESFGDKEPKGVSKLQKISSDVNQEMLPKVTSVYNTGKARDFSAKQANLAKYASYNTEVFGKLGFDPFKAGTEKKSGMDIMYDTNTSWTKDIRRAYDGMYKLAGIGLQDTFGLGAFANQGNYLTFEDTMNKYSSSRGGNAGFWSNTMLSSGYTGGIILGIAAEELALFGITAATGGLASAGTVAAGGTLLVRGFQKIKNVNNLLKTVNKLQDVSTATSWLGRSGKSVMKALNPLENTFDFIKDVDKLKDLNGWKQTALGVGTVVRDARKITMAHSESKLESDLAAKEFKQKMYDEYFEDFENIGKPISENKLKQIEEEGNNLSNKVYSANFGLIYATNAITFDNMFKNMKSSRKAFNLLNDAYKVSRTQGGKAAVEVVAKTFGNTIRKKLGQVTYKSAIKSALSSSMEGVQELGQDIISESMKSYYARNVKGTQVRGGMLEYLHNDLVNATVNLNDAGSTFLSGALMGVFASPVGFATGQVNNFLSNGGINKTYQRTFKNEKWKAEKVSVEARRKEKAKYLTDFFNDNKNFIDGFSNPMFALNELQERILNAAENNDAKTLKTTQHESFVIGIHKLLESGLENEFAEHLIQMANQFGAQEFNEIFARTDITDENKNDYKQKLLDQAAEVKKLKSVYNEIQQSVVNPNDISNLKTSDPDYLNKFIKYRAFENLKKELLFSHSKIADKANRLESIKKELVDQSTLSSFEVNSLINAKALDQQIKLLSLEVEANSEMTLDKQGLVKSKIAQQKLKAYQNYKAKLDEYKKEQNKDEGVIYEQESFDDLFEAYNELLIASDENNVDFKLVVQSEAEKENNKKVFEKVFDYLNLGEENKYYQEFVDTLMNPSGASAYLTGQEEMLKRLEENKEEHISNALKAFEEKTISSEMLNALYEEGLFFDLSELDDLIKNRVMPSEIFDIENNNQEATQEQYRAAQDIIDGFVKKLTGKSIVNDKTSLNKQGRRLVSDKRTVSNIIRQYNLKLNKTIKLSSKEGKRLLQKMMAAENKNFTKLDREILAKLGEQDASIRFITNGTLPIQITEDGVIEMDLRFAGRDFKNSPMSFENLMVTGLTQKRITERLKEDDELWLSTRNAMEQAKVEFKKLYPSANVDEMAIFDSPELFLTEAMNDLAFQKVLAKINDTIQPSSKSLWSTLSDGIKDIIEEDFDKKLVNRVINIAAKALDSSIIDNISETDTSETKKEEDLKNKEKFDELSKLAEDLGKRWNVNVKVLASQQEALDILTSIQDPFYQKFSTILNDLLYDPLYMGFNLQKGVNQVSLKELLKSIYEKSDSLSELIQNLKDLSVYQTNEKVLDMINWLTKNADNIGDGLDIVKDIFFQNEGQNTAGFYDEKTNTAYIVADAVKPNTVYHEIFLHPYLINLEKTNPELYRTLVAEASNNSAAIEYVEKHYGLKADIGVRQFEHELVGRVYDLNINNQLDQVKDAGLIKKLGTFIKEMFKSIIKYLGINKTDITRLNEKKATIADLAKYAVAESTPFDLGKVIEAEKPVSKTKTVTRERTVTTLEQVNEGGELMVLNNAAEQPGLFEDFLRPEIYFHDNEAVKKSTEEIIEIGEELDVKNIIKDGVWRFGDLRVEVDGRLMIDVIATVPIFDASKQTINQKYKELQDKLIAEKAQLATLNQPGTLETKQAEFDAAQIETIKKNEELKAQGLTNEEIESNPDFLSIRDRMDAARIELDSFKNLPVGKSKEDLEVSIKETEDQLKLEPESITTKTATVQQVGTKEVRFLMYKSTGTGSNAATKGEWTPLIHIGKRIDPNTRAVSEWFVKALYNNEDPKINKYGSSSFAELDKILKDQEDQLFDKPANWVSRPVDTTVEEVVEVPFDQIDDIQETPISNTEAIVSAEEIQSKIQSIEKQIEGLNQIIASDESFMKKRSARQKLLTASMELNDLYLQLNDIQSNLDVIKNTSAAEEVTVEYVPIFDYNNNEVITHETPWIAIPKELRMQLAAIFGKSLNKISQEDVLAIKAEIKNNPVYITAIFNFSNNRLTQQDLELGEKELAENKKRIDEAKTLRNQQVEEDTALTKLTKKQQRQARVTPNNEDILKSLLKDFDYSILTAKEIDSLIEKFKDKSGMLEFTVNDIIGYITNKKIQLEKEKLKEKIKEENIVSAELVKIRIETNKRVEDNFKMLSLRVILFKNNLGKEVKKTVPMGMVKFISKYHPEIFKLPYAEFAEKVSEILDIRTNRLITLKSKPIEFKPKAIHLQLHSLFKSLEKKKELFPETVHKINLALYKAGSDFRIKMVRPGKNSTVSSMYYIGKKSKGEIRTAVGAGKYAKVRGFLKNAELEYGSTLNSKLAILQYFLSGGKVKPNAVSKFFKEGSTELKDWKNLLSDTANPKTNTFDSAGGFILETAGLDVTTDGEYAELGPEAFSDFFKDYSNLSDAIKKIGAEIIGAAKVEKQEVGTLLGNVSKDELDELNEIDELIERGRTKQEAIDEVNTLKFLQTDEGKAILDKEASDLNQYFDSKQSEIIEGAFEGDEEELSEEDQALLSISEQKGLYGAEVVEEEIEEVNVETPVKIEKVEKNILDTAIERQVTAFFNDIEVNIPLSVQVNNIFDAINNKNRGNLIYAFAAYKYIRNTAMPTAEKEKTDVRIILNEHFRTGVFANKILNIENNSFRVAGFQSQKIVLQNLQNPNEFINYDLDELISKTIEELQVGEKFNNQNIDSVVKVNEIDYIKEAYNEILDNFTSFMGEAVALSDEELMQSLKVETTKCK